jgi:hypothetical protein
MRAFVAVLTWSALIVLCGEHLSRAGEITASAEKQTMGPVCGSLLIVGGGDPGSGVLSRFIALAGGPAALILVIPTAREEEPARSFALSVLFRKMEFLAASPRGLEKPGR